MKLVNSSACFNVKYFPGDYVVGGTVAHEFQYPWHVGIMGHNRTKRHCGGSLITKQHVLSAAHCMFHPLENYPFEAEELRVILGAEADNGLPRFSSIKIMNISKIDIHPNFSNVLDYDFAILTFTKSLIYFTKRMKPVCLPSAKVDKGKICNVHEFLGL